MTSLDIRDMKGKKRVEKLMWKVEQIHKQWLSAPSPSGEIDTRESPANEALNKEMAARMANLLEGLDFPITKEQIINHLQNRAGDTNQNMDDILKFVQSRLQNNLKYNNVYEIEKTMNLVKER